jgi:hypothetical protein
MPCVLEAVRRDVFTFSLKIFGGSCAALLQSHLLAEAIKFVGRITLDLRIYQGNITIAEFLLSVFPDKREAYCLIITLRIGNRSVAVAYEIKLARCGELSGALPWGRAQQSRRCWTLASSDEAPVA